MMNDRPTADRGLGAVPRDHGVDFTVWAPHADRIQLDLEERCFDMEPVADGYHVAHVDDCGIGQRYGFRLDDATWLPDPASRSQPDGVHGRSEVVEPGVGPSAAPTPGARPRPPHRPVEDMIISEIHVGTFSRKGTFRAAIDQLDRLVDVGITTIELMPINQFPGARNWGYDGVFAFAAQNTYGGRGELMDLIDAAHERHLSVLIDVVHNHLGPEGNHLAHLRPYFTDKHTTPWGPAVNVAEASSDPVRRYFIDSAVEWVRDVGADGLRLDAVHSIVDSTAVTFIEQLVEAVHHAAAEQGREAVITAESSANDPRLITSRGDGGLGCDAVWNDDYHHALRVALTGDRSGYYIDYDGIDDVERCLRSGWTFDGRYSQARGRTHGRAAATDGQRVPFHRLVVCDQNHDQIGNRAAGERLDALVGTECRKLAAAAVLLSPFTPMLFMGEEYGETAPFPFFVDHSDESILEATRTGRRSEFPDHAPADVPDPADPATFESAILRPEMIDLPLHSALLALHRDLIDLRKNLFTADRHRTPNVVRRGDTIELEYPRTSSSGSSTPGQRVVMNLGPQRQRLADLGPCSIKMDTSWTIYGGPTERPPGRVDTLELAPWSAVVVDPISPDSLSPDSASPDSVSS